MYEKILFPVTTAEVTESLINSAGSFIHTGAKEIVMLHVVDSTDLYGDPIIINADRSLLLKWKANLISYNFDIIRARIEVGIPWEEISDIAEKEDFSLIYMGSHGSRLLKRVFLGSVTENVLHHSTKPLLIHKFRNRTGSDYDPDYETTENNLFKKILYATDFSENSKKCIPYIDSISPHVNEELIMLHIQDLRTLKYVSEEKISQFNKIDYERFDALKEHFQNMGYTNIKSLIKTGQSIIEILDIINQLKPTLVIMGAKGKTNLKEMLLGSVTEIIVHKSKSPILIVR